MIIVLTYVVAALVLGLYIAWFLHRYRRDQRAKAAEEERTAQQLRAAMPPITPRVEASPATLSASPPSAETPSAAPTPAPTPTPAASSGGPGARSVAEALAGISMPHDLVPVTSFPPRQGVVDQVAFSSRAPVSVVGPLFADELERLGYTVTPLQDDVVAAKRGNDNIVVYIHAEAPPPIPEGTVVIEVCVPF